MTKKDYILIADVIKNELIDCNTIPDQESKNLAQCAILSLAENLTVELQKDNSRFNHKKFMDYILL